MQRNRPTIVISALAALSLFLAGGCFSYHSTREESTPTAQVPPSEPPGSTTTTTTTTQSDNGNVHQHSTTTYNP